MFKVGDRVRLSGVSEYGRHVHGMTGVVENCMNKGKLHVRLDKRYCDEKIFTGGVIVNASQCRRLVKKKKAHLINHTWAGTYKKEVPPALSGILPTWINDQTAEFLFDLQKRVNWLLDQHRG